MMERARNAADSANSGGANPAGVVLSDREHPNNYSVCEHGCVQRWAKRVVGYEYVVKMRQNECHNVCLKIIRNCVP